MPLGIVKEEDWLNEVTKKENNITHEQIIRGRKDTKEIPEVIRETAVESSILGDKAKDIKEKLGISLSSISAYKHGVNSTNVYNEKKQSNLVKARERINEQAGNNLLKALSALEAKNLAYEDARDVSSIAKDMASIVEKITPKEQISNNNNIRLTIFAPQMKQLSDYEIIDSVTIDE